MTSRRFGIGVGCGLLAGLLALAASLTSPGRAIEAQTFDWRVAAQRSPPSRDFAIVEINESTVRALAPIAGRWPWPRLFHAGVIDYLSRSRARAIVYDVQFTEADSLGNYRVGNRTITGPDSDAELIASVTRAGNVVLLADVLFTDLETESASLRNESQPDLPGTTYAPGGPLPERQSVRLPFPDLRNAAAAIGHNLLQKDAGGVSRAMAPFITAHGVAVPSLGLAAVLLSNHVKRDDVRLSNRALRVNSRSAPLREDGQLLLKLRGPHVPSPSGPIPVYSFFDVLLSEENARAGQAPAIPASAFTGKTVFVGTSASGLSDVHATAFGGSTPGVYLQATLADNFASGEFMRRSSPGIDVAAVLATSAIAGLAVMVLPVWWALAGISLVIIAASAWATHLAGNGLWVPLAGPWAAAVLASSNALAWQYFVEGREKRQVRRLFGKYVSPEIVHQLMTNPSLVRIGGERRNMSVLFSDIRGFTAASEHSAPEAVVEQLNEYFGEMVDVLFRHRGTLDKFVGDQVMGLFGAPVEDAMHADHAVAAAIDMSAALDRLNARWAAVGRPALEIGIGINSGDMIAGNIGSEAIMSYTVIGDAVNLGARIESLNKEFGTRILISQATRDALTQPVQTRRVGDATVKGRREGVTVHEVTGIALFVFMMTVGVAGRAEGQLGQLGGRVGQAKEALDRVNRAVQDLKFTPEEERQLGEEVSAKLRERYGVVQDESVHRYVSLAGSVVAAGSSSAGLPWTFIVLDTDGVNAFAAPGGFVHITRGALVLIQNEAELAGVIGHEVGHVMARHTIRAIQKTRIEGAVAKAATRSDFLQQISNRLYAITLENSFDRGDEMEADKVGVSLASTAGYAPTGLSGFLTSLAERNKATSERSGLFASHPDMSARLDAIAKEIRRQPSFSGKALVQARYVSSVPRTSGSGAFGLAGMKALGAEKSSSSTIASAGSRGVNSDRDARGGPNKALVSVTVTPEGIAEFRKGIVG